MITKIEILQHPHGQGLPLPSYGTSQSAGLDLMAAIEDPITLAPMERLLIPTGISIALPVGFEAQIRPRSGLALKHGITVLNSPGTVDADYRGELQILLINFGNTPFVVERGMRIAQMVVKRFESVHLEQVAAFSVNTKRGENGWGSTGTHG